MVNRIPEYPSVTANSHPLWPYRLSDDWHIHVEALRHVKRLMFYDPFTAHPLLSIHLGDVTIYEGFCYDKCTGVPNYTTDWPACTLHDATAYYHRATPKSKWQMTISDGLRAFHEVQKRFQYHHRPPVKDGIRRGIAALIQRSTAFIRRNARTAYLNVLDRWQEGTRARRLQLAMDLHKLGEDVPEAHRHPNPIPIKNHG
jgi:hypothetical protein